MQSVQNSFGNIAIIRTCSTCNGEGEVIDFRHKCHGKGSIRKTKTIEVDVPAGIDAGQMIKLSGQGELGTRGGQGDLYIEECKSHSPYKRRLWCLSRNAYNICPSNFRR